MNPDSTDPSSSAPGPEPEPSARKTAQESLDDLSRFLTEAIRKGGRDARRSFAEGMPKVKSEFSQGLYEFAYAVGYAATFGASVLREATPDSLAKGFREGSASGRRAADEAMRRRQERAGGGAGEAGDAGEGAWA